MPASNRVIICVCCAGVIDCIVSWRTKDLWMLCIYNKTWASHMTLLIEKKKSTKSCDQFLQFQHFFTLKSWATKPFQWCACTNYVIMFPNLDVIFHKYYYIKTVYRSTLPQIFTFFLNLFHDIWMVLYTRSKHWSEFKLVFTSQISMSPCTIVVRGLSSLGKKSQQLSTTKWLSFLLAFPLSGRWEVRDPHLMASILARYVFPQNPYMYLFS